VNDIVSLNGIFDENVMSSDIKHHISFNSQVIGTMDSQSSVVALMN
jgi:hypothetical protein